VTGAPRATFLLLLACCLLILPGAAGAQAPGGTKITVGQPLEPPILDPTAGAANAIKEVAFQTVFEGLVKLGPSGEVEPLLAKAWTISPDGLTYAFQLRRGVRFHDGRPFTAADVKFTFDRDRAATSANAQKIRFQLIDRIETLDPYTVRIRLKRRFGGFLSMLGWGDAAILSPATAASDATRPVGTGPFRFEAWRRGEAVFLGRNPDYWGRPARVGEVVFRFIADPTAAYSALDAGDVDVFANFPAPETLARLARDPRFRVAVAPTEGKTILALNNRAGPLANVRVRRALSLAVDRSAVIRGAMFGYGQPIGSHYPPQDPGYVDLTGVYPHDPARARSLLAQAGYPHGFSATLKLPPPSYARRSGEIIAAEFAEVGVTTRIQDLEWAQWLDQVFARDDFQMTIVAHTESMDYDIYARPNYYFGYKSPRYRALNQALDETTDAGRRNKILGDMQRLLAADAVNVFLFDFPALGVWNARLKNIWAPTPVSLLDLTDATVVGAAGGAGAEGEGEAGAPAWLWPILILPLAAIGAWGAWRAGPGRVAARLAAMAATLVAASVVVFVLLQIAPGDPASFMMGMNADPKSIAALRHAFGLDAPAWRRYLGWVLGMLRGDFGQSYTYRVPVAGLIVERLAVSLPLTLYALVLSTTTALVLGLVAAAGPHGLIDKVFTVVTSLGVAIPNFWFGLVLVLLFSGGLRWFSAGGFPGWSAGPGAALRALTLPAIALALPQAAILARVLRAELLPRMNEDFVRTARAKGLSMRAALVRHALPNALIPVLTILGLQFSFLLAGAIIVENVFFLPGLGRLVIQAIAQRDLITVEDVVMLLVLATLAAAALVDLVHFGVDPRLRGRR